MIDTLRLAQELETAGMPRTQAEAVSRGLANGLREQVASKADLESLFHKIIAAVAGIILLHFGAVWALLAAKLP